MGGPDSGTKLDYEREYPLKTIYLLTLALTANVAAYADFSYNQTTKATQGPAQSSKIYFRGSRMATDTPRGTSIIDFGAQTVTVIDKAGRTYAVKKFSEIMPAGKGMVEPKLDVKDTGATQTINGLRCTETTISTSMDAPAPAKPGTKVRIDIDLWMSTAVPGWQSLQSFYKANGNALNAIAAGSSGLAKVMAELQKRIMSTNGVQVRQSTRLSTLGKDPLTPQSPAFETVIENSGFSASPVSDAVFAIPPGFTKR